VSFATCSWIASCIASFSDLNASITPNISAPLAPISDKAFKNATSSAPTEMGAISIVQCISSGADESELDRSVGRNLTYLEKCLCRSLLGDCKILSWEKLRKSTIRPGKMMDVLNSPGAVRAALLG
jgi:hypothetical protein